MESEFETWLLKTHNLLPWLELEKVRELKAAFEAGWDAGIQDDHEQQAWTDMGDDL
jgi:hypothetical protein